MRGGEESDQQGMGMADPAVTKGSALLGRALTHLSDLAWRIFFNLLTVFRTSPPTPEQLYVQHLREREAAITHYLETHRRRDQ